MWCRYYGGCKVYQTSECRERDCIWERRFGFISQLCLSLVGETWENYFSSLNFRILICKMDIVWWMYQNVWVILFLIFYLFIIYLLFIYLLFIYLFWLPPSLLWHAGSLVAACGLLSWGMWALSCGMRAGSSSLTRDQTWPPALGVWNLTHWTTREVLEWFLNEIIVMEVLCKFYSCYYVCY